MWTFVWSFHAYFHHSHLFDKDINLHLVVHSAFYAFIVKNSNTRMKVKRMKIPVVVNEKHFKWREIDGFFSLKNKTKKQDTKPKSISLKATCTFQYA